VVQPPFHAKSSSWRGKNFAYHMLWRLYPFWNIVSLFFVRKALGSFVGMHIRCAIGVQKNLCWYEFYLFGTATCMNEMKFLVWRGDGIVLNIALRSLVSWKKCVKNLNVFLENFT
jgi:hypothetical protein